MAQHQLSPEVPMNFIDKTKATSKSVASSGASVATPANYASQTAIDARLTAISALYTAARLNSMTLNDKVYAIRLADDAGTL